MADAAIHRRHDLVQVRPAVWRAWLVDQQDLAEIPEVRDWADRQHPVIVRRRLPGEDPALVPVGLPLPPSLGKRRIPLLLRPADIWPDAPVSLDMARRSAPERWQRTIDAVLAVAPCRVFGSLLWQVLTGLAYLSANSDLDLLWPMPSLPTATFLQRLAAIDAVAPMRLDGEILLPDGAGIHWRELHGGERPLLAKTLEHVDLRDPIAAQ